MMIPSAQIQPAIQQAIRDSIRVKQAIAAELQARIAAAIEIIVAALHGGRRLFTIGNGGSAADAQHFAAELVGSFLDKRRKGYDALALTANSSTLTSIINDSKSEASVFERQVEAHLKPGDVLFAISTSGNSANILRAIEAARKRDGRVIGLTGEDGGGMQDLCDVLLNVPSNHTPRIQEAHILVIHIICEHVEREMERLKAARR